MYVVRRHKLVSAAVVLALGAGIAVALNQGVGASTAGSPPLPKDRITNSTRQSLTPTSTTPSAAPSAAKPSPTPTVTRSEAQGALETNPQLAQKYAEQSVGNCLETAWTNDGYPSLFDSYVGNGVVQFSTGTSASPTGNFASDTLIDVRVDADGGVTGIPSGGAGGPSTALADSALDYWGCRPGNQSPVDPKQSPPAGLQPAGPLRVSCTVTHNNSAEADGANIVMYNPTGRPITVTNFGVEWASNGIGMSQSGPITDGNTIYPGEVARSWITGAPPAANSCVIVGWN